MLQGNCLLDRRFNGLYSLPGDGKQQETGNCMLQTPGVELVVKSLTE
jgi:hypothetical protein